MRLNLSEDERIVEQAAAAFFAERCPVSALRALRDADDPHGFDRDVWRDIADMGWPAVLVPEALDGAGMGYGSAGVIMEQAGRTLAAAPLLSTGLLAIPMLVRAGNTALQEKLLPGLIAGERIATLAIDEGPHHEPGQTATVAVQGDNGFRLDGAKQFVVDGHAADLILVVARIDGAGSGVFVLESGATGVRVARRRMVDSRNMASLTLDDVAVDADALLCAGTAADEALEYVLDGARAGLAAEMLGGAQEAFDRTLAYLKLREQFDVPIGSFQALKHRAALMFCELELTRSAVRAASLHTTTSSPRRLAGHRPTTAFRSTQSARARVSSTRLASANSWRACSPALGSSRMRG